jgi:uncharacterized protein (TIGR00288 family)
MAREKLLLGFGVVVFGMVAGVSWAVDRNVPRSLVSGTIALASTYAGGMVVQGDQRSTSDGAIASSAPLSPTASDEVAVFWDYENVKVATQEGKAPLAESLISYSKRKGHLRFKMVYANWRREREPLVQALYSLGFEPIHVSTGKENSVDIKLTVDCLNTAHQHPDIQQFIIVTADRDFVPLVTALRTLRKQVTLIGRTETASEQLLLSADEFIDLDKLAADEAYPAPAENHTPVSPISYEEAIACLTDSISQARDQGKSTRFGPIDLLMRANSRFSYSGFQSIRQNGEVFSNFSAFIARAEAEGIVKVYTLGGFKELFLPNEDPEVESEFSGEISDNIDRSQWNIILDQVRLSFQEGQPGPTYGRFLVIFKYVRDAKKDERLKLTNGQLKQALSRLVETQILVEQANGTYQLVADLDERRDAYIDLLLNHSPPAA